MGSCYKIIEYKTKRNLLKNSSYKPHQLHPTVVMNGCREFHNVMAIAPNVCESLIREMNSSFL